MKKLRFLLFAIFFLMTIPAVCANAATSSVTIGGTVYESNTSPLYLLTDTEGNITSENASASNYNICIKNFSGNQITLNNATIKATDSHAVYSPVDLTVEGIGTNKIISVSTASDDTYKGIYSGGSLVIKGSIDEISAFGDAVNATKSITISAAIKNITSRRNGIYAKNNEITVSGSISEINSGNDGIDANSGAVTISGNIGKINNKADYLESGADRICGIHAHYGDITISGTVGEITSVAKYGITHSTTVYGLWSYGNDITITGTVGNITTVFDNSFNAYRQAASGMLAKNITIKGSVGDMICDDSAMSVNGKIAINGTVGNIHCSVVDNRENQASSHAIYSNGGLYKDSNGIDITGSVGDIDISIEGAYSDFTVSAVYTTEFTLKGSIGNISSETYGINARTILFEKNSKTGDLTGNDKALYTSSSIHFQGKTGNINSVRCGGAFLVDETAEIGNISNGLYCSGSTSIYGKTGNISRLSAFSFSAMDNSVVGNIPGGISSQRGVSLFGTIGDIGGIYCVGELAIGGTVGRIYGSPAIQAYGGIRLTGRTILVSPANGIIAIKNPNQYQSLWYTVKVNGDCATTVIFGKMPYSLTVTNGSGSGNYAAGTEVAISANTKHCIDFSEWTLSPTIVFKEGNKNTPEAIIIMPDIDTYISATFNPIDEKLHKLTVINKKDATCHEDGHRQYYKCSCGSVFADEYRQTQITDLDTWLKTDGCLKSEGHYFFSGWTTVEYGNSTMNGLEKKECRRCDYVEYRIVMTRRYAFGDIDMNGTVTSADARLALRFSVDLEYLTSDQKRLADYDENETVTAADARLILRRSVGLEEEKLTENKYSELPNLQKAEYPQK